MNQVYDALRNGPGWPGTVFVITYDEWGGFFDHVPPSHAHDVSRITSLRGFRVPTVVISPFARRGFVSHQTFDHTSILKMIEWRWGLKALTPRDKYAQNIATVLDLAHADTSSPTYAVDPAPPPPVTCSSGPQSAGSEDGEWSGLKKIARARGWAVPA